MNQNIARDSRQCRRGGGTKWSKLRWLCEGGTCDRYQNVGSVGMDSEKKRTSGWRREQTIWEENQGLQSVMKSIQNICSSLALISPLSGFRYATPPSICAYSTYMSRNLNQRFRRMQNHPHVTSLSFCWFAFCGWNLVWEREVIEGSETHGAREGERKR